jgi:predicted nucleic-acid-binding protein
VVIDTNFVLRYLLRDNPQQFIQVQALFESSQLVHVADIVIFECVYTIGSQLYQKSRQQIVTSLKILLLQPTINSNQQVLLPTLDLYLSSGLDFADCYLIYTAISLGQPLKTFDKKMLKTYQQLIT